MRLSARFEEPRETWSHALHRRALEGMTNHDLGHLLELFRSMGPYYSERLSGVTSWQDIPPLEKEDIGRIDLQRREGEQVFEFSTSGTSGIRVTVANTAEEQLYRRTLIYRPFGFYDLPAETRQVSFVDETIDGIVVPREDVIDCDRHYARWKVSARATPEEQLEVLRRLKPHLLAGFPSALIRLVETVGNAVRQCGVHIVTPGGEFIPDDWRRSLVDAFEVPVYDRYGATESGSLAWECPRCGSYHANADETVIEPDAGSLLVTPLFLTLQPLLRYRLDDRVAWMQNASGSCDIQLPSIKIYEARRDDWLYDGLNRKVSPVAFQFHAIDGLVAWKVWQAPDGTVTIFADWRGGLTLAAQESLKREGEQVIPGRLIVVQENTKRCPATGKFKRVVCNYETPCVLDRK